MHSPLAAAKTDLFNTPLNENSLAVVFSGPREIRTLDLLNAIETRSQLRYGPIFTLFLLFTMALPIPREGDFVRYGPLSSNGPGGIRTLDLFSAIEARSQLRYRPVSFQISRLDILPNKWRSCQGANHLLAIIRKNRVESSPKINGISILQAFSASRIVPCSVTSV